MLGLARWLVRGLRRPATPARSPSRSSGDRRCQALPSGLVEALPSVSPAALSMAVDQVRAGKYDVDLVREFGLRLHEAKVITAYAVSGE